VPLWCVRRPLHTHRSRGHLHTCIAVVYRTGKVLQRMRAARAPVPNQPPQPRKHTSPNLAISKPTWHSTTGQIWPTFDMPTAATSPTAQRRTAMSYPTASCASPAAKGRTRQHLQSTPAALRNVHPMSTTAPAKAVGTTHLRASFPKWQHTNHHDHQQKHMHRLSTVRVRRKRKHQSTTCRTTRHG